LRYDGKTVAMVGDNEQLWGTIAIRDALRPSVGRESEGIEQMQAGLVAGQVLGETTLLPHLLDVLAEAHGQTGKMEVAPSRECLPQENAPGSPAGALENH
jgi:hypothetical protein